MAADSDLPPEPFDTENRRTLLPGRETFAVVDIGSSRVACAYCEKDLGRLSLVAAESVAAYGIRGGEIVDLERASEAIRIAVEAVGARAETEIRSVVVGFSGAVWLSQARAGMPLPGSAHEVSEGDIARLRRSLHAENAAKRRVIHRFDGPYSVGDLAGVERPVGLCGPTLGMTSAFLAVPTDRWQNLVRALRKAGLEIEALAVEPMAASCGALSQDERVLGAAVLDFGAGGFRGALWEGGRLRQIYVSALDQRTPVAGATNEAGGGMENVVMGVARRFRIAPATARRLMQDHGALQREGPGEVLDVAAVDGLGSVRLNTAELSAALEELLHPVVRAMRDGLSGFSAAHAGGVVLVGQGAQLPGLAELAARHFGGAPVRLGQPRWDGGAHTIGAIPAETNGPGGCSLCGLALYAAELRAHADRKKGSAWWRRISGRLRRVAASL
ncbi:MAG: hypothetical protein L6R28_14600 [Planctomycetes bacterium]|nr:hypothetical protein [Planctomycetota bacterium]